jgi:hypothetical protein
MDQMTYRASEKVKAAEQLRIRGHRMLELATRAYCERHYDFARLLRRLADEVFAHADEAEQSYGLRRCPVRIRPTGSHRR